MLDRASWCSLRNADVLIDGRAELKLGWLPPLLQNARNPKIEIDEPGRVQASRGVRLMNVPANVTRTAGDVHALGNPHFMVESNHRQGGCAAVCGNRCRLSIQQHGILRSELQEIRDDHQFEVTGMGYRYVGVPRAARGRVSPFVAVFAHRFGVNIDIFLEPKPGFRRRLRICGR